MSPPRSFATILALVGISLMVSAGCGTRVDFQPNLVYLTKQETTAKMELSIGQRRNLSALLELMFGTPDEPRLPELPDLDLSQVLDPESLQLAAGRVYSDQAGKPFGLYREHCAACHGINGNGAGPTAAFLDPFPRDFRRGIFKYKSTAGPLTPPTDEDLLRVLRNGNPGTSMPSFQRLNDSELEALVDYVKYLSLRGEVERALIFESIDTLEDEYDQLVDLTLQEDDPEAFEQEMRYVLGIVSDVAGRWAAADEEVTPVPASPTGWDLAESIRIGEELFRGEVANCAKCHGPEGRGDGQNDDYDDWAREIVDPLNPRASDRYVALGALPPRKVQPRDLHRGLFRGGGQPEDLYRRIVNGIAGTPMPAAPLKPADAPADDQRLTEDDIWHLVHYVLSLAGDMQHENRGEAVEQVAER